MSVNESTDLYADVTARAVARHQVETAEVVIWPGSPDPDVRAGGRMTVRVTRDTRRGVVVEATSIPRDLTRYEPPRFTPLLAAIPEHDGATDPAWSRTVVYDLDEGGVNSHLVPGAVAALDVIASDAGHSATAMTRAAKASMNVLTCPRSTHRVVAGQAPRDAGEEFDWPPTWLITGGRGRSLR